jgi:hypothetical protein
MSMSLDLDTIEARERRRRQRKVVITDEAYEAVRAAYPYGASREAVAQACGVSVSSAWQWEKKALAKLRHRLSVAGFEWTEPTYLPCITDGGDGQDYGGEVGSILAARDAISAERAKVRAERERELSALSPMVAKLCEDLDRAAWRGRRAALVLGEVRERAVTIDAEAQS